MSDTHQEHETHHGNYVKIWAILCGLLIVSILGPMLEIRVVTLVTAFGIAFVKAYLVAKNFMHLNLEPRYVVMMLVASLAFILLFFVTVAPDVMQDEGAGWTKPSYEYHDRMAAEAAAAQELGGEH